MPSQARTKNSSSSQSSTYKNVKKKNNASVTLKIDGYHRWDTLNKKEGLINQF